MTPISKELSAQINQEAADYSAVQYGDPAKMQGLREIAAFDNGVEDYTAGATAYAHYKERCEELERWKREAIELLTPLLDYGQSKEANIPLGASVTAVILQRAKQFEQAKKALEEYVAAYKPLPWQKVSDNANYKLYQQVNTLLASWKEEGKEGGNHE